MTPDRIPSWQDMAVACRRMETLKPEVTLADHSFGMVRLRPYFMAEGWTVPIHQHSFYEASIILSGTARTTYPVEAPLRPGSVYYHAPHSPHSWSAPNEPCHRLILWFTVTPAVAMPSPNPWPTSPTILSLSLNLLETLLQCEAAWRDLATAQLSLLFAHILTLADLPGSSGDQPPAVGFSENLDAFLRENLHRPLQLADIATCFAISQSTLTHRYREETGLSVGQRLTSLRMQEAARLLASTDLTLDTIATQVGLTDAPYLCRVFKRYFNRTPNQYRSETTVL